MNPGYMNLVAFDRFNNLDAGQPKVVQRGSPWYEKYFFGCFCGQNLKSRL